jgi:hypothetical protein
MARKAPSIDSRRESPMHDLHRAFPCASSSKKSADRRTANSECSARDASGLRNGIRACSRTFFLAIPDLSGKIPNLSAEIPDLLFAGTGFPSSGEDRNFPRQASNFHFQTSHCEEETLNFPGEVRPARKEASHFEARAQIFAAKFIHKRDMFGIAKKKLRNAGRKSRGHRVQKSVCRAQACPAKHPDGYREVPF